VSGATLTVSWTNHWDLPGWWFNIKAERNARFWGSAVMLLGLYLELTFHGGTVRKEPA
jgi:hypothetical protein